MPDPLRGTVPRWLPLVTVAVSVLGLAVAGYLTIEHYTASRTLACSDNGVVNCLKVTTSAQSSVFSVPVADLGLLYFAAMTVLCLPPLWRSRTQAVWWVRIGAAAGGAVFVVYLIYAELFVIGNICLWCTAVHVLAVALFGLIVLGAALAEPSTGDRR